VAAHPVGDEKQMTALVSELRLGLRQARLPDAHGLGELGDQKLILVRRARPAGVADAEGLHNQRGTSNLRIRLVHRRFHGIDLTRFPDTSALAPEDGYYQRLLARDQSEAADLIERYIKTESPRSVYEALLLPGLNYAERDRLEQRLSTDEETAVVDVTRELLSDAAESIRGLKPEPAPVPDGAPFPGPREPLRVLGYATNGVADELALAMLAHLLDDLPIHVDITGTRMLASELLALVHTQGFSVVCFADLPPSPSSKTRLSRQETPRGAARAPNPGGAMGTAGAGGRQHSGAAG
jgi:hypothetical protein